jgi:hypothetical protein
MAGKKSKNALEYTRKKHNSGANGLKQDGRARHTSLSNKQHLAMLAPSVYVRLGYRCRINSWGVLFLPLYYRGQGCRSLFTTTSTLQIRRTTPGGITNTRYRGIIKVQGS